MILLIDNYDSFSYNLVQLVGSLRPDIRVVRNDAMNIPAIRALSPTHIILSPGPGYPGDAGICEAAVRELKDEIPILGVCLGHQAICEVFGARIAHAKKLMHGKQSLISVDRGCPIFQGLPEKLPAARYHSLAAVRETMPDSLRITAEDAAGEIMAVQYRNRPVFGLQFHPESILTPDGMTMLKNFIDMEV